MTGVRKTRAERRKAEKEKRIRFRREGDTELLEIERREQIEGIRSRDTEEGRKAAREEEERQRREQFRWKQEMVWQGSEASKMWTTQSGIRVATWNAAKVSHAEAVEMEDEPEAAAELVRKTHAAWHDAKMRRALLMSQGETAGLGGQKGPDRLEEERDGTEGEGPAKKKRDQ